MLQIIIPLGVKLSVGVFMKRKYLNFAALVALFSLIFSLLIFAAEPIDNTARCWYYKRNGAERPTFPSDAEFISQHGGYFVGREGEKRIYLTFDAGYENGNVEKILDILRDNGVPAAFFILKNIVLKNPDLIRRMGAEGHLVCNHTKNHKDMTTLTEEEMIANLHFLDELCLEKTGVSVAPYFRFPEGRYSPRTVITAEEAGYKTVFWSLSHDDWDNSRQPDPERSLKRLLENTHDGAILLLHPTSETNVRILPELITRWREMGYSFGTLDELTAK